VAKENVDAFIKASKEENLEATPVAEVTDDRRLVMYWRGKAIVDIKRDFLDTNGVKQNTNVLVAAPLEEEYYFAGIPKEAEDYSKDLRDAWIRNLQRLNVCSQKGLVRDLTVPSVPERC